MNEAQREKLLALARRTVAVWDDMYEQGLSCDELLFSWLLEHAPTEDMRELLNEIDAEVKK